MCADFSLPEINTAQAIQIYNLESLSQYSSNYLKHQLKVKKPQ